MLDKLIAEATECDFKVALEIRKTKSWLKTSQSAINLSIALMEILRASVSSCFIAVSKKGIGALHAGCLFEVIKSVVEYSADGIIILPDIRSSRKAM